MSEEENDNRTSLEFAGIKFTGGKMVMVVTALSTLVGGLYGAFEVYKDYMDMKEQIQSYVAPDLSGFQEQLSILNERMIAAETSVTEALDYARDIKNDLRDDILRMEKVVDRVEDQVDITEGKVKDMIDVAEQRFDNKRDQLSADTERKIKDIETTLNDKIQRALDNPLAD
jgi:vacuolar-type H+-ATPase subunit H